MAPDIKYIPIEPVERRSKLDKLADWIWGRKTEIVFCAVLILLAAVIIPVMMAWAVHQLAMIGV